jgi:hypothetical protein
MISPRSTQSNDSCATTGDWLHLLQHRDYADHLCRFRDLDNLDRPLGYDSRWSRPKQHMVHQLAVVLPDCRSEYLLDHPISNDICIRSCWNDSESYWPVGI